MEVTYKPDHLVVNQKMESLGLLLFFCLAFDCSNQDEVVTLEDKIKTHLNEDPITKQLLAGIYGQEDFVTPQFKTLLHLSLNNLLISNEIYASTDTDGSLGLPQAGDNIQQENEMLLNLLNTDEERSQFQEEYASLTSEIATAVDHKYGTHYTGGYTARYDRTESIASLLTLDEIQSPLRVHSFNTLIHKFLGVLELSGLETMSQYPGDNIDFSRKYWSEMLKVYSASDRSFLGTDTALFLVLKISLQNLAQTRLFRIKTTSTLLDLEEKLNLIQTVVGNPSHRDQLMNAIKRTQAMLSNAQKERTKSHAASKILHSTLLQACSNDGNNQPSVEGGGHNPLRGNSDTRTGSGLNGDYEEEEPESNSCTCNEYEILLKHLKTCPDPQIQIPQEITNLSTHYNEIEDSIRVIQETISNLSTEELLAEVKTLSEFMTSDMSEMSHTLQHITENYNSSITFFKNFETGLDKIKEIYIYYKLHLLVYIGLSGLAVLVTIQIISVFFKIVQCYPLVKDYLSDWKAFRESRQAQRVEGFGNLDQNLPLVPIVQRAR